MENRWVIKPEVKEKYKIIVGEWLHRMETLTVEEVENMKYEDFEINLSDTELNPYTLSDLLQEEFGYIEDEDRFSTNGWQLDFWMYLYKSGVSFNSCCENLSISGCGMTFKLILRVDID